jgi:uncharacterized protein
MQIAVTGATGLVGSSLCGALVQTGHEVTALVRDPARAAGLLPSSVRLQAWDAEHRQEWAHCVADVDAIVNLAGESLAGSRWSPELKQRLRASRIDSTHAIVATMQRSARPGQVLLSASAVGYYGDRGDATLTEAAPAGTDFLANLCRDWEAEAARAAECGARVVLLRSGIVLDRTHGALPRLAAPFRWFAGGPLGSGRQWVSWIHAEDEIGMILWALQTPQVVGPVNLTSPSPVTNRQFAVAVGRALGRPAVMTVPAPLLRLVVGEMADTLLGGQKAIPDVAQTLGYEWKYPSLEGALAAELG